MSLLLEQELQRNKDRNIKVQKSTSEWLGGDVDDYTHAVTLTYHFEIKDELDADIYVKRFSDRLNRMSNRINTHPRTPETIVVILCIDFLEGAIGNLQ